MTIMAWTALHAQRVLVLCPKSLKLNWAREVERWTSARCVTVVVRSSSDAPKLREALGAATPPITPLAVVVNYHLAIRDEILDVLAPPSAAAPWWDLLALDESHAIRNPSARVSKAVLKRLWPLARHRLAISGTPLPNGRASEAFLLFARMAPDLFGHWPTFKKRYCVEVETPWGVQYTRSKNLEELGRLARERFMVRRPPEEVLAQLPGLVRQTIPLEVPEARVREAQESLGSLEAAVREIMRAVESGIPLTSDPISTARKKLGALKAPYAVEFVADLLDEVESVVAFCHHREVFHALREGLERFGVVGVSGETPGAERQKAVDAFQSPDGPDGSPRVFLASITAASTGITLTRAHTVVFVEADWIPSTNDQAEGRVLRVTQTELCRAIYLVVPDSLDEVVERITARKRRDVARVLA